MRLLLSAFFLLHICLLTAQPTQSGLIAYYSFNNDECAPRDVTGNAANEGILNADTSLCACGAELDGMFFDGVEDYYTVAGSSVLDLFDTEDFTISFYVKSKIEGDFGGEQVIISKKSDDCATDNSFEITYSPDSRFVSVLFSENDDIEANVRGPGDITSCWQWVTVIRRGLTTSLYINGKLIDEETAERRVNLSNESVLTIGKAHCNLFDVNFSGVLDDIRFYNRALQRSEIEDLNYFPDRIANNAFTGDTLIFKGSAVQTRLTTTDCIESYDWTPAEQVCPGCTEVTDAEPELLPQETTTFTVAMRDTLGCTAFDTLRVTVIDPDTLDCTTAFLPKAFTPNFDGLNDTYGIDNPLVIDELRIFEIYDRWGERIFVTNNPQERWDGSFQGTEMNAGVYFYVIEFTCNGEVRNKTESFTIIR